MTSTTPYFRAQVTSWTDSLIHAVADGRPIAIDYSTENPYFAGHDWSYLSRTIQRGSTLNLVNPHWEGDVCSPEIIIVEPDLLMDITAVAACLEDYAESPLVSLLNRLRPGKHTSATMLGNLASQLLDEALRHLDRPYRESALQFFRSNALQLATTDIPADFHKQAQEQARNMQELVNTQLNQEVPAFRPDMTVLEPTFFCEMLGLQGRMDLLQLDLSMLIEQKSGKDDSFNRTDPKTPMAQRKHALQAVLYYAMLHYGLGVPEDEVTPYLYYSKFTNGLLPIERTADVLHTGLRLRNQLARCEQIYAHDGYGVIPRLTPDSLRLHRGNDKLWERYTKPELTALLEPIRKASALEINYYLRFMQFVSQEHLLAKYNPTQLEGNDFAAKWRDTLEQKHQAGNICDNLVLAYPASPADTDIEEVILQADESSTATGATNFRLGDIVVLYPYLAGTTPDLRRVPCLRGSLSYIDDHTLRVRLRAAQSSANYFYLQEKLLPGVEKTKRRSKKSQTQGKEIRWALEHDLYESSTTTLHRGLHAFLSAPQPRRDLVLSQRRPIVDTSLTLRGDYGAFNDLALRVRQARELFLIIGPPGTGKTSFGLMTTLREELHDPDASVLILSYTNRAVDEACSKLMEAGLDFIRLGSGLACSEECKPHLLEQRVTDIDTAEGVAQLVKRTRIFAATVMTMCGHLELFRLKKFSLAIVDEASQILEPHLLPLLSATHNEEPALQKVVMIGDHKQLPAVVQQTEEQSRITHPLLRQIGLTDCRRSLFERLLAHHRTDESVVYMLTHQGRMHPSVAAFPNQAFYEGRLDIAGLPHQTVTSPAPRVNWIEVEPTIKATTDKVNLAEAAAIAQLVIALTEEGFTPATEIGIIVPYRNQISAVNAQLAALNAQRTTPIADLTPMIDTVERYQGSQRRIIIYGFTVQQAYQLEFLTSQTFEENGALIDRKLNVAMTRAMERLYLVGNASFLRHAPVFRQLLDYLMP